MQLSETAVDQDQARDRFLVFLQAFVAASDDLSHGCEIVDSFERS